jgi:Mg/Co/Ni transporter MgtE
MFNIFKKKNGANDTQKLGMFQRLAIKKAMNMSSQEKEKLMQDMMKPENHAKLLKAMEMMKKSGILNEAQMEEAKKRLGM